MDRMKLANEAAQKFINELNKKKTLTKGEREVKEVLERKPIDGKVLFYEGGGFTNKLNMDF